MSRRPPKSNNKFQFVATILIAAIATIWLGLLGNYVLKQMAPVNQIPDSSTSPEQSATSPEPVPPEQSVPRPGTAPPIPVTPIPPTTPSVPAPTAKAPTTPFKLPDNPALTTPPPTLPPIGGEPKFNHLPYDEAPGDLVQVGTYYDRAELMVQEAAQAFWNMEDRAKQAGINLGPISGFRTVADQGQLFTRQIGRHNGSEQEAAKLSAPPGYSEHHTGYTIDIRDRDSPETDLKYQLENTRAYNWLTQNACQYGFELSFPDNNNQGVSFEPWHWRYVSSPTGQQIFANAHQRYPSSTNCSSF